MCINIAEIRHVAYQIPKIRTSRVKDFHVKGHGNTFHGFGEALDEELGEGAGEHAREPTRDIQSVRLCIVCICVAN